MASHLGGSLASFDRWGGLMEWHRRHQNLLGEQSTSTNLEGCSTQFQSSISNGSPVKKDPPLKNVLQIPENSEMIPAPTAKLDLSIIPEADEDSRSRDGDLETLRSMQGIQKSWTEPQKTDLSSKTSENSTLRNQISRGHSDSLKSSMQQNTSSNNSVVAKRSFLRRGQGLVKYNLKPEDVKRPYRKDQTAAAHTTEDRPKPSTLAVKCQSSNKATVRSSERFERNPAKQSKTDDLQIPMQHLVLSIPTQKASTVGKPSAVENASTVEIGTWSQVFGFNPNHSTGSVAENSSSNASHAQLFSKQDVPKASAFQTESRRIGNAMTPSRKIYPRNKTNTPPEEDLESLAAYLDLEQHVGNASFCSTSSKVDRLVTKSSKPFIHQSNPDAITQSKQLTPVKTGRKFLSKGRATNASQEDHLAMWSVTDIENLIKARARRSGSLVKALPESNKPTVKISSVPIIDKGNGKRLPNAEQPSSRISAEVPIRTSQNELSSALQDAQDIDLMLETLGPTRKPHLMKTMSSIDLDSSLIKNALVSTGAQEEGEGKSESETQTESSSSESSSEEELEEDFTSGVNGCANIKPLSKPVELSQPPKDLGTVSRMPFKLVSDATLEEINHQIDSHLSDLRKEIETLQSAKEKTQKYTSSLEKKVQELEHRLIVDARSFNKRLEEEKQAAAEEQGKCLKEKQALQRNLREERRKAPDPVTQQELLRLKQEIAQWEEKWRADRAKARGLESNLRIQLTNLKRENEKLKEENSKIRREKETALNTAKAKASSNTRVINSIAQHLGNVKPKVTIVREENPKPKKGMGGSAYNLKAASHVKDSNPTATIENFPKLPHTANNEWSTDEEIDLGKETSDEDDITDHREVEKIIGKLQPPEHPVNNLRAHENGTHKLPTLEQEPIDIQAAQAKYDAIFGTSDIDSVITQPINTAFEETNRLQNPTLPQVPAVGNPGSTSNNVDNEKFVKSIHHSDGKVEQVKENGTRVITYPDGTWRRHCTSGSIMTVPPSGCPVQISYFNGDQLEKLSDGTTIYFYAKTGVWQTTHPDGHEELQYPSGQVERREPDGSVRVLLPGSSSKSNNSKISHSDCNAPSDGVSVEKLPNGDTVILLPNGESELHTKDFMKKDFLDGTIKFLYKDGSQETRYPSGRVRIKDAQGNLVKDTSVA